jgi:hypothetical protein
MSGVATLRCGIYHGDQSMAFFTTPQRSRDALKPCRRRAGDFLRCANKGSEAAMPSMVHFHEDALAGAGKAGGDPC